MSALLGIDTQETNFYRSPQEPRLMVPIWITVDSLQKLKNNAPNQDPSTDVAFSGGWPGIYCASTCQSLILNWTHVEFRAPH